MTRQNHVTDLLSFYASGALSERQRQAVDEHLSECAECRSELAFWIEVGRAVVREEELMPDPGPLALEGALRNISKERPGLLLRAWQLLCAQTPLVRREIWSTSALVMGIGYIMALVVSASGQGERIIAAIAPLIAAAGVAMIYGPENDPALELALATPTSSRQVLLARLVLVFGYNLLLALVATLGLLAITPVELLGSIIMEWLGPMTFLSALALVLSLEIGANGAMTIVLLAWLSRWMAGGLNSEPSVAADVGAHVSVLVQAYLHAWTNSLLLLALAVLLGVAAFFIVGREQPALGHGSPIE